MLNEILQAQAQARARGEEPRSLYLSYENGHRLGYTVSGRSYCSGMTVYLGRDVKDAWLQRMTKNALANATLHSDTIRDRIEVRFGYYVDVPSREVMNVLVHTICVDTHDLIDPTRHSAVETRAHAGIYEWLRDTTEGMATPPKMVFCSPSRDRMYRPSSVGFTFRTNDTVPTQVSDYIRFGEINSDTIHANRITAGSINASRWVNRPATVAPRLDNAIDSLASMVDADTMRRVMEVNDSMRAAQRTRQLWPTDGISAATIGSNTDYEVMWRGGGTNNVVLTNPTDPAPSPTPDPAREP